MSAHNRGDLKESKKVIFILTDTLRVYFNDA